MGVRGILLQDLCSEGSSTGGGCLRENGRRLCRVHHRGSWARAGGGWRVGVKRSLVSVYPSPFPLQKAVLPWAWRERGMQAGRGPGLKLAPMWWGSLGTES